MCNSRCYGGSSHRAQNAKTQEITQCLASYVETKQIVSTEVCLRWQYLILFNDKTTKERQEIEITFNTRPYHNFRGNDGYIRIKIAHTARTWGKDMEAMLVNHIKGIIDNKAGLSHWFWQNRWNLAYVLPALVVLLGLAVGIWFLYKGSKAQLNKERQQIHSIFKGKKVGYPERTSKEMEQMAVFYAKKSADHILGIWLLLAFRRRDLCQGLFSEVVVTGYLLSQGCLFKKHSPFRGFFKATSSGGGCLLFSLEASKPTS